MFRQYQTWVVDADEVVKLVSSVRRGTSPSGFTRSDYAVMPSDLRNQRSTSRISTGLIVPGRMHLTISQRAIESRVNPP